MDIKRYLAVTVGSLALAGPATAGVKAAIVKLNEGGPSYLYSDQKISPGDTVHFQFPKDDQPSCCGRSDWKAAALLTADPDAVDYASDRPLYRYRIGITGVSTTLPFLGIAVIGNKLSVQQAHAGHIEVRQNGAATDLRFCTSQEGVHLISRSAGKQERHLYIYLAYDIENPTCAADIMN
jgi:hypothetical protein